MEGRPQQPELTESVLCAHVCFIILLTEGGIF